MGTREYRTRAPNIDQYGRLLATERRVRARQIICVASSVTAPHHSTDWRARMPACGAASASPWQRSSLPRLVSARAFRPAEHRINRESQRRRSAPTTSAQTSSLSSPVACARAASPSAQAAGRRRAMMAAVAGSSESIRILSAHPRRSRLPDTAALRGNRDSGCHLNLVLRRQYASSSARRSTRCPARQHRRGEFLA